MASLSLLVDSNKIKHIKQTYFPKANVQNFTKMMHIIFISFTAFLFFPLVLIQPLEEPVHKENQEHVSVIEGEGQHIPCFIA